MNIIAGRHTELSGIKTVAILADPACRSGWEKNFPPLLEYVWRKHKPELFLVAGDLAIDGETDEYRAFLSAIGRYPAWFAAVPGDHDKPLRDFVKHFGSTRKVLDVGKWRFLGVNTADRVFRKSEAVFLEKNIRRNTLILSHVPPAMDGWTFHCLHPVSSNRFLSVINRQRSKVTAAFFGHIHGYSRREYSGIPLVVTGAVAESLTVRDNRYGGPGFFQMMIFKTATGKLTLCRLK